MPRIAERWSPSSATIGRTVRQADRDRSLDAQIVEALAALILADLREFPEIEQPDLELREAA